MTVLENRRNFVKTLFAGTVSQRAFPKMRAQDRSVRHLGGKRTVPVALVQFDAVPEQIERNLQEIERLTQQAVSLGARWVMFHEGTICDYTPRVRELAEPVPTGSSTRRIEKLAHGLQCYISFGLSEADRGRYYITQVFVEPNGFVYRYRKTWLWRSPPDKGYRNEWVRYDPGDGPGLFLFDGVKATCFICADGGAPRCIERAAELAPQVVFYANNHAGPPKAEEEGERARKIGAPMLVTNRVGYSWMHKMMGGSLVCSATGDVLASANKESKEEILLHKIEIQL
jgi:predicted amidohydrolase